MAYINKFHVYPWDWHTYLPIRPGVVVPEGSVWGGSPMTDLECMGQVLNNLYNPFSTTRNVGKYVLSFMECLGQVVQCFELVLELA